MYNVEVTNTAWEHLMEHTRFIANVSRSAATQFVADFREITGSLSEMPERCSWLQHSEIPFEKYRKIMIDKYHMVLFQISGKTVYITAVVDCRKEYSWLL